MGYKGVKVVKEGYFYFSPSKGLGFWDICSVHCLVKELGGGIFYDSGEEVIYPTKKEVLSDVIIFSRNKDYIEKFISVLKENDVKF